MRKRILSVFLSVFLLCTIATPALAQPGTHKVAAGDTMWKLAVKYQIGLSELIEANPQIKDPKLIYVGQTINIPNIDDVKKLEEEVARLVNAERAKQGLPALRLNWELSRVARYKSNDFVSKNYFAHQSPTYGSPFDMMKNFGIRFTAGGENIAKGQNTPAAVMNSWMNSPGHRGNIMSSAYNEIGIGAAKDSRGTLYWTQLFIKSA